jgi:hypothetical protein
LTVAKFDRCLTTPGGFPAAFPLLDFSAAFDRRLTTI